MLPLILVLSGALWLIWRYSHFWRSGLPFLPPWPVVGNMGPIAFRQMSFHELATSFYARLGPHRCGGLFTFTSPVLLPRDADLIALLFVKKFDHFCDHQELVPESADPLFAKSLFGLPGQRWKDMRRILSPAFTPNKLKNMIPLIKEIAQQMRDYLKTEMETSGNEQRKVTIEAKDFFSRVSNDVIASTAFGARINSLIERDNQFYSMGKEITDFGPRKTAIIFGYLLLPKLMQLLGIKFMRDKCYHFFTSLIREAISERGRQRIIRHDMVHLLMQASKGELQDTSVENFIENSIALGDVDLAAQAMIFIFGGFDTVSTLLSFTTYLLAVNQEMQQKLQQEVDKLLCSKTDITFTYEDIAACKYLDMVISETLRLYPPFAVMGRTCVKEYTVQKSETGEPAIHIKPGDFIWLPIAGLHHDPDLFPNPEKFDPERFSDERKKLIKPMSYVPFGVGPRYCIAQRFALMEVKAVIIYLLSQFTLEPTERTPMRIKFTASGFSPIVDGGLWLAIRSRS